MTTSDDWFRGPEIDDTGDLYKALVKVMHAPVSAIRHGVCWVMNPDWYRRVRAMAVTEEQENARAFEHAKAVIPILAVFPMRCPACTRGPYATMADLSAHAEAMSDPANREPADGDYLLGIPIEVRDDGGLPHIESKNHPAQ